MKVELLATEPGEAVKFDRVLLVNKEGATSVGTPFVSDAFVEGQVLRHERGPKKIVFRMKRRKGYHKTKGHRQETTVVKINQINA